MLKAKILIVEDERIVAFDIKQQLQNIGYEVIGIASTGEKAVRQATARKWRPFYCPNPLCDGRPHDEWGWNHARADQRPHRTRCRHRQTAVTRRPADR